MKRTTTLTFLFLTLFTHLSAQSWKLVWSDEFDGNQIDTTKWVKIPRGPSDWNNYMSADDSLYEVKDGHLVLRGVVNDFLPTDTAAYLTGGVYTKEKYHVKYGKVSIRAKLPNATGCWPAFWMLPAVRGAWPNGGEIDIMEHLNHDDIAYQTIHTEYTLKLGQKENPRSHGTAPMDKHGYNTYSLEKCKEKLVFYVNDVVTFEYPRLEPFNPIQYPFDEPFYILLDMQLGGSWVGKVNPKELPVEMQIDWIRVYECNECES
ncbi:MAG: glycoside hydrolase family 16 protein [Phocaeicola sp.]